VRSAHLDLEGDSGHLNQVCRRGGPRLRPSRPGRWCASRASYTASPHLPLRVRILLGTPFVFNKLAVLASTQAASGKQGVSMSTSFDAQPCLALGEGRLAFWSRRPGSGEGAPEERAAPPCYTPGEEKRRLQRQLRGPHRGRILSFLAPSDLGPGPLTCNACIPSRDQLSGGRASTSGTCLAPFPLFSQPTPSGGVPRGST